MRVIAGTVVTMLRLPIITLQQKNSCGKAKLKKLNIPMCLSTHQPY